MSPPRITKVLLIDDDPDIRQIARLSLERLGGLRVACAASGREGVAMLADELPDVILLDVTMPEMDGPETLAALRRCPKGESVPVFFLTAASRPADMQRLLALGAAGILHKPFDPVLLPDEIRRIVGDLDR